MKPTTQLIDYTTVRYVAKFRALAAPGYGVILSAAARRGLEVMRNDHVIPAAQCAACEAHQARADERAADLAPFVKELQATGTTSLNGIARALNARRIRTPAGRRRWHPTQVRRVLARLAV
jgi:hypothetical protein